MKRLILLSTVAETIEGHLAASAPLEEGAFCLLRIGRGQVDSRLLGDAVELPPADAWAVQRRDQLVPVSWWVSALIGRAIEAESGLLFVHSHPESTYPPGLSAVDYRAFAEMGRMIAPMLDGPLAAAVVHPTGWSAVVWEDGEIIPVERVQALGRTLRFLSPAPAMADDPLDLRQRSALGAVQDVLRSLSVGVIGCGGIGSPLAEQLARMGVGELVLVDHDRLDTASNVRRVFGSTVADLAPKPVPAKVDVVGDHLDRIGLATVVRRIDGDVRTEVVARALLDVDLVLIGTDTHGSRAIVNDLVSAYFLPAIDVGVRVGSKLDGSLAGLFAEVRALTPKTPCLWCRGTIDGATIAAENLPEQQRRERIREGYVVGSVGQPAPSVVALTVLGSSLAASALLAMLSTDGITAPTGYVIDGFLGDGRITAGDEPNAACRCRGLMGKGDNVVIPFLAAGAGAEDTAA